MFGRATITLGIGPHSSLFCIWAANRDGCVKLAAAARFSSLLSYLIWFVHNLFDPCTVFSPRELTLNHVRYYAVVCRLSVNVHAPYSAG